MRLLRLLVFVALCLIAAPATAQGVVPDDLNISGLWVHEPTVIPPHVRPASLECRAINWASHGRSSLELELIEVDFGPSHHNYKYQGSLRYYQGYSSRIDSYWDWMCHVEVLEHNVVLQVSHQLDNGAIEFGGMICASPLDATLRCDPPATGPPYFHWYGRYIYGGHFVKKDGSSFALPSSAVAANLVPFDLRTTTPVECGISPLMDMKYGRYDGTDCVGEADFYMVFVRQSGPFPFLPTGEIGGRFRDTLPDGTPTTDGIDRGEVQLYRQDGRMQERTLAETDATWAAYVAAERSRWTLVQRQNIYPGGAFRFDRVPEFTEFSTSMRNGFKRGLYTIEIKGPERDIDVGGEITTLVYPPKSVHNVRVGFDDTVYLSAITELAVKREVADRLQGVAPFQYAAVEQGVKGYLDQLDAGTITPTDPLLEGVNRGIWAERSVLLAAELAKSLLEVALNSLAELVGQLVDKKFTGTTKALGDKKKEFQDLKDQQAFFSGLNPRFGFSGRDYAGLQDSIDKLSKEDPIVKSSAMFETVSTLFKYAILPVKTGLTRAGMEPGQAAEIVGILDDYVMKLLEAVFTWDIKGIAETAAKDLIVKGGTQALFDTSSDTIPSFARLSRPMLERSDTQMRGWTTDNRVAYANDRSTTVNTIAKYLSLGGGILGEAAYLQAIAGATSTAASIYALGGRNPWVKAAEMLSKNTSRLAHFGAFVRPLVYLYTDLLDATQLATYQAFGQVPPQPYTALPGYPSAAAYSPGPSADHAAARDAFNTPYFALRTALAAGELYDAMLLTSDEGPDGFLGGVRGLTQAQTLAAAAASGAIGETDEVEYMNMRLAQLMQRFRIAFVTVWNRLATLYADVLTLKYGSPDEGPYRVALAEALDALDVLNQAARNFQLEMNAIDGELAGQEVLPTLVVTSTDVVSSNGGGRVTARGESFTVSATIRNASSVAIPNVSVRLEALGDESANVTVTTGVQNLGSLPAFDASGSDAKSVTWQVTYDGEPSELYGVVMSLKLLENGDSPASFGAIDAAIGLLPDTSVFDADNDGLPDPWERAHGLDPTTDDYDDDFDADGLANHREHELGLDPTAADTDGDALTDGQEVIGGDDGWVTDPLAADTDGDGEPDATDGSPLDSATTDPTSPPQDPRVAVEVTNVTLDSDDAVVTIPVTNAGGGTLVWTAGADEPGFLKVTPAVSDLAKEGQSVRITLAESLAYYAETTVVVRVVDLWGQDPDEVEIRVHIPGTYVPTQTPGDDMGMGMSDAGQPSTNGADTGTDMEEVIPVNGGNSGTAGNGGCCRVVSAPTPASRLGWVLTLLLLGLLRPLTGRR